MKSKQKNILVAPLDWGLGHAARCIPIINLLLQQENITIYLAVNQNLKAFYQKEYSNIEYINFEGYEISYSKKFNYLKTIWNAPKIISKINQEQKALKEIVKKYNIQTIISDNRYGLYHDEIKSVFIGHQINIQSPVGEGFFRTISDSYINKFDECWIPDGELENSLAGNLVHGKPLPKNAKLIGHLSRFEKLESNEENKGEVLVMISGPEPQRSIFEEIIKAQLPTLKKYFPKKITILGGQPQKERNEKKEGVAFFSHLPQKALQEQIKTAELIITRPGYTTLMEMAALQKKTLLIPTPGQTEQIYLAKYLSAKNMALSLSQNSFGKNLETKLISFQSKNFQTLPYQSLNGKVILDLLKTT